MGIPKNIIQTWKSKKISPEYQTMSNTWKTINPDYNYIFYTDNDCYKFMYNNYSFL